MTTTYITRVIRGGSWRFAPQNARVAGRSSFTPDYRYDILGVRLVEEPIEERTTYREIHPSNRGSDWSLNSLSAENVRRYDYIPGCKRNNLGVRLVEEKNEH